MAKGAFGGMVKGVLVGMLAGACLGGAAALGMALGAFPARTAWMLIACAASLAFLAVMYRALPKCAAQGEKGGA